MRLTILQKGCFRAGVGLLLFAVNPLPIFYFGTYDGDGDLDTEFSLLLLFTCIFGFGLYLVGAAHISISPASLLHKLLAVWLPLVAVAAGYGALLYAFS